MYINIGYNIKKYINKIGWHTNTHIRVYIFSDKR